MKNRATRKLVAKEVPVYLAKYFPQGIFRLRGRGSRKDAALYVAVRKHLWEPKRATSQISTGFSQKN